MINTINEAETPERKELREKLIDLVSDKNVIDALKNDDSYTDKDVEKESGSEKLKSKEDLIKRLSNKASGISTLKTSYMKVLVNKLQQIKTKVDSDDEKVETKPINIDINRILVDLHKRSMEEAKESNVMIFNDAFEQDGDSFKYKGPGDYFIRFMQLEENPLPDKESVAQIATTYVKRFSNNNVDVKPIDLGEIIDDGKNNVNERELITKGLLFEMFGEAEDTTRVEQTDKSDEQDNSNVIGYILSYRCIYGNQKGNRISWGKALFDKMFGNTIKDLQSLKFKYRNNEINVGKIFKKETYRDNIINANTICGDIKKVFDQEYPNNESNARIESGKSVSNLLVKKDKRLESKDQEKLIKNPYCISITVDHDDINYEQYSKDSIAAIISKAIGKSFDLIDRGQIKGDDLIYIQNFYVDQKEFAKDRREGERITRLLQRAGLNENQQNIYMTTSDKLQRLLFESDKKEHTVIFVFKDQQGNTIGGKDVKVKHGESATPPDTYKPGYKFIEWEIDDHHDYHNVTRDTYVNGIFKLSSKDVYIFSDENIQYENEKKQDKEFKNDATMQTKKEKWLNPDKK